MQSQYLSLRWSTSRARDTLGQNVLTLTPQDGKRVTTCGGNYDMEGTVLGDWLEREYQDRLRAISHRFGWWDRDAGTQDRAKAPDRLYGGTTYRHDGSVHLDGGCGDVAMEKIAAAIGLSVQWVYSRGSKPHRIAIIVQDERATVEA